MITQDQLIPDIRGKMNSILAHWISQQDEILRTQRGQYWSCFVATICKYDDDGDAGRVKQ